VAIIFTADLGAYLNHSLVIVKEAEGWDIDMLIEGAPVLKGAAEDLNPITSEYLF